MWINIPDLKEKCQKFIDDNPELKISKFIEKRGTFVFYRKFKAWKSNEEYETADFTIILVKMGRDEGWSVDYMRHTSKWTNLLIFGTFEECLKEIKNGKWMVLMPLR